MSLCVSLSVRVAKVSVPNFWAGRPWTALGDGSALLEKMLSSPSPPPEAKLLLNSFHSAFPPSPCTKARTPCSAVGSERGVFINKFSFKLLFLPSTSLG